MAGASLTVIQLARLGDLAQILPLIQALQRGGPVRLLCDSSVREWADLLPGVDEVRCLDTRQWRSRSLGRLMEINPLLNDLRAEIAPFADHPENVYPLNDFPTANLLASSFCSGHFDSAFLSRLLLVRSYIRLIASIHPINRIHLSDLWRSLAGTQFAPTPFESNNRRKSKHLWAFILGSGAKCRRLEPEDFAAWWLAIPADDRPEAVLIGGPGEEDLAARFIARTGECSASILNLVGVCSPAKLLEIFRNIDLVIGVDTGPLHWATVMGTRVLGVYFGEAGFHDTGPYGNGNLVLSPNCPEYPCHPDRAQGCGWRCRTAFKNPGNVAGLLTSLARGENPCSDPFGDLKLSQSSLETYGNRFESFSNEPDSPEITVFSDLVRSVLGLDSRVRENDNTGGNDKIKQLHRWCAAWIDQIKGFSFGAAIPEKGQADARAESSKTIRSARDELLSRSNAENEDPAAERCVFSGQPESVGA
jgi:ADP-heptose:LPS heptosyltransferase